MSLFLDRSAHHFVIAERLYLRPDRLPGFMAYAGDQEKVSGAKRAHRLVNGLFAIADLDPLGESLHDLRPDARGVLAARIVVGHIADVGEAPHHLAHLRPFSPVAIP